MISNREWRQIASALFHSSIGNDQSGNTMLYLRPALGILREFALPGASFDLTGNQLTTHTDPKHDEPDPIILKNPIRLPMVDEALEILRTGGSDIGEVDLVTAAHVVVGDLKSAISGRDFWKKAAEESERNADAMAQRILDLEKQVAAHEANLSCAQAALKQDRLILESFSLDHDFDDRPERTAVVKAIDGIDGVMKGISQVEVVKGLKR